MLSAENVTCQLVGLNVKETDSDCDTMCKKQGLDLNENLKDWRGAARDLGLLTTVDLMPSFRAQLARMSL